MKINKPVILLILLIVSAFVKGQNIFIKGSGSGYANAELKFYSQTDPVTKRIKPLLHIRCGDDGSFSCVLPCNKSKLIFINAGIFKFRLYVTEGQSYELLFPNFVAKSGIEDQNPFFKETELMPEVINNKQGLNNLIRDFDSEYDPVFNFVADRVFRNYKNEDLQKEISKLDKYPVVQDLPFYTSYVRCRKLMLQLVLSSAGADKIKALEFINSNFDSGNQAYSDLAEQMFSGYFHNYLSGPLKDSFSRAIATGSFSELKAVIMRDAKITNKELTDFVILLNLNADYYNHSLPAENVRKIISLVRSQGESEFVKNIASVMLYKINSSLAGNFLPDFSLADNAGKFLSLKDFRGKYVLLGFARSDNSPSLMELGIINMWQKKYSNDIQIVTVLADSNFISGSAKMKKSGFKWIFLDGSNRDSLEFIYDIKMYPSFILLDREGKIIEDPCSYPSEELELKINKMLVANPGHSSPEDR
jgi:thiol-disulfide isomerase/thioredoxin